MGLFADLRRAKELGLNLTTVLVKAYLDENGPSPMGQIARACDVSIRSVERAIASLKTTGFFYSQKTTSMTHDHVLHLSERDRTATGMTAGTDGVVAPSVEERHAADPLAMRLLDAGVLPWCVDTLLAKVDRAAIERQLAYHEHRLNVGYKFKAHPAKFLFAACLNDYAPPADYHVVRQQPRAAVSAPSEVAAAPAPAPEAPVELTRAGALTVIRMGVRSKLPSMRQEALRLARVWGVDLRDFGAPPEVLAEFDRLAVAG
ncbi:MAG: hypothetical protein ACK46X_17055 [Candidatus Sericytochromatia bacterium]